MKLYIILFLLSSFSFAQTSLKVKEEFYSIEIFEKIIKEFNIDSKRKYMEVYEDSKELGLPPLSKLSQIYPEWKGWGESSPKKTSDWVKKEIRKIQEDLNDSEGFGGNEAFGEELEEKHSPTKKEKKIVQKKNPILKRSSEKKNLVPYEELKKIVRDQGVKTRKYYSVWREKNKGMFNGKKLPSSPQTHYDEWEGWGEFLGKPPIAPYEELKKILIDQGLKSIKDYHLLREKNKGMFNGWKIPSNPNIYYDEWEGWGVFLGKKPPLPFTSYEELKKIVRDQGLKSIKDYHLLREKNKGMFNGWRMPSNPDKHYKEWTNWNEFFGNRSLPLAPYEELKKITRDQGIKSAKDYHLFRTENKGVFNGWRIPSNPHRYYDEWKGWSNFFEKPPIAPYEELKKAVRDQGLKTSKDYQLLREKNEGVLNDWRMPSNPDKYYEKEWVNWNEFFGNRSFPLAPYKELKKILIDQRVKSTREYRLLREKNKGVINGWKLPSEPHKKYKEWVNWNEFLGKLPIASYEELKKAVRDQGVKTRRYYSVWREKNKGVFNERRIPSNPDKLYKEWVSWNEFLGKKHSLPLAPYEELKKITRDQGLKKSEEYFSWREKNKGVFNGWRIPSNPHRYYGNKWEGWDVFFGKSSLPFASYEELKKIIRDQGIKSRREYNNQRYKLEGVLNGWKLPSNPHTHYGDEWKSWPEFLNKCETAFKEVGHR